MKKLLFLICTVFALFSCEGPEGPMGPQGPTGDWKVEYVDIPSNKWELVSSDITEEKYFQYIVDSPTLNLDIYDYGSVMVYYMPNYDTNNEVQTPLPYVVHRTDEEGHLWTETYSYDFNAGTLAFYVRYSDFFAGQNPPRCVFRVLLGY